VFVLLVEAGFDVAFSMGIVLLVYKFGQKHQTTDQVTRYFSELCSGTTDQLNKYLVVISEISEILIFTLHLVGVSCR
jgi:hypothetical protein